MDKGWWSSRARRKTCWQIRSMSARAVSCRKSVIKKALRGFAFCAFALIWNDNANFSKGLFLKLENN
nr:hypothetical protein [Suttonella indologenes]